MPKFFRVVLVVLFFIEFSMTEIVRPTTPSKFVKYELTSKVLAFGRIAAFIQMSSTNVLARSIDFEKKIVGSLMNRVASDTATAYFPGIDQADIYYPNWYDTQYRKYCYLTACCTPGFLVNGKLAAFSIQSIIL